MSESTPKQARNTSFPVKSFITVLIISGAFFYSSCSVNTEGPRISQPAKLLPDSVYIPLLANIQLMQVWNSSTDTVALDSIKQALFETLVDEKQFLNSHRYYQSDFEGQRTRLDSVKILLKPKKGGYKNSSEI